MAKYQGAYRAELDKEEEVPFKEGQPQDADAEAAPLNE